MNVSTVAFNDHVNATVKLQFATSIVKTDNNNKKKTSVT